MQATKHGSRPNKQQPTMMMIMMIMKRKRAPVGLLLFRYVSNHFAVDHSTPHRVKSDFFPQLISIVDFWYIHMPMQT